MASKHTKTYLKQFWLLKSEPSCYSIDDFARDGKALWTGVRNYQARNFLRNMQVGDQFFFYHSSTDPTAIAGIGKITAVAKADMTAFDKKDDHFDPKSTKENPIWYAPEVTFVKKFKNQITLSALKRENLLAGMALLQTGSRLSVQPVSEKQFSHILNLSPQK